MSPYISEPHFVPLKCGLTEDTPHNVLSGTAVGTIQAGLSWPLAPQTGLLDVLWLLMAIIIIFFTVQQGNSPPSPITALGISELGKASGKQCVKKLSLIHISEPTRPSP